MPTFRLATILLASLAAAGSLGCGLALGIDDFSEGPTSGSGEGANGDGASGQGGAPSTTAAGGEAAHGGHGGAELVAAVTTAVTGVTSTASGQICTPIDCFGESGKGLVSCGGNMLDCSGIAGYDYCTCTAVSPATGVRIIVFPPVSVGQSARLVLAGPPAIDSYHWDLDGSFCGGGGQTDHCDYKGSTCPGDARLRILDLPAMTGGGVVDPGEHNLLLFALHPDTGCKGSHLATIKFVIP